MRYGCEKLRSRRVGLNRIGVRFPTRDFCLLHSIHAGLMPISHLSKGHWWYAIEAWKKGVAHFIFIPWPNSPDAETYMWQHTTLLRDRRLFPRRDWNPQSKEASCRRRTPRSAWQLGSVAPFYGRHWNYPVLYIRQTQAQWLFYLYLLFPWRWMTSDCQISLRGLILI